MSVQDAVHLLGGDGNKVKATLGGVTTVYIGNDYEVQGTTIRKYYYLWGKRVAARKLQLLPARRPRRARTMRARVDSSSTRRMYRPAR